MKVDRDKLELAILPDSKELGELLPEYHDSSNDPAGLHVGASPNAQARAIAKEH
jgi:hypothetical protein